MLLCPLLRADTGNERLKVRQRIEVGVEGGDGHCGIGAADSRAAELAERHDLGALSGIDAEVHVRSRCVAGHTERPMVWPVDTVCPFVTSITER
jgi:hypothetical protein